MNTRRKGSIYCILFFWISPKKLNHFWNGFSIAWQMKYFSLGQNSGSKHNLSNQIGYVIFKPWLHIRWILTHLPSTNCEMVFASHSLFFARVPQTYNSLHTFPIFGPSLFRIWSDWENVWILVEVKCVSNALPREKWPHTYALFFSH